MEHFTVKDLDIPFPEIKGINIGGCPGKDTHYYPVDSFQSHTHQCNKDEFYKNICISDKEYLFNTDGSVSDVMWHEYAHVLDTTFNVLKIESCNAKGMHMFELATTEDKKNWEASGHGPVWRTLMRRFGKEPTLVVARPTKPGLL